MPTELGVCHFRLASVGQAPADPKLTTVNKDVTTQLKHSLQYSAHAICTMHTGTKEKKEEIFDMTIQTVPIYYPSQTEGQDTAPWQKSSPIQSPKLLP